MAMTHPLEKAESVGRTMGRDAVDSGDIRIDTTADTLHSLAVSRGTSGRLSCGLTYDFVGDRAAFVAFVYGFTTFALYWRKTNSA